MKVTKFHIIGTILAVVLIGISFLFYTSKFFPLLFGLGIIIGIMPYVITIIKENQKENEKEQMFLEFTRSLAESVKTGTPISKSIINVKDKPFGVLSPNVRKLANQISIGIPLRIALRTFSRDTNNRTISRALTLIGQAEQAGGDIGKILESASSAINVSDKLKKERKASISTLVVQGYIIFFIFIIIVLVMQFKIIPMLSGISGFSGVSGMVGGTEGGAINQSEIANSFLYLLLIQGFFSGLAIGKLSEGNIKNGLKHSVALVVVSFIIFVSANLLFG